MEKYIYFNNRTKKENFKKFHGKIHHHDTNHTFHRCLFFILHLTSIGLDNFCNVARSLNTRISFIPKVKFYISLFFLNV